jgi:amidase
MQTKRAAPKEELVFWTATQLAQAIRDRRVSSTEVVDAYLNRIARLNPTLRAIATVDEERARKRAKEADEALAKGQTWGPLHGVPVTIKDSFETAGLRTTSSFKPLKNHVPSQDATLVSRLRNAGAIIMAKTNMSELASDMQSNSAIFGRANNPWDLSRTPGGSTGGGAAAIAAGLSPLEVGSDGAGSIRHPAHFCGVFGINPTKFIVSGAGRLPPLHRDRTRGVRSFGSFGPLARSVEDLKLGLSAIAGPDIRDWKVPPVRIEEPSYRPLEKLRFAWSDDFAGAPLSSDTRAALRDLADKLTDAGCRVEKANPPGFDFEDAWRTFGEISGTEIAASLPGWLRVVGRVVSAVQLPIGGLYFKGDPISRATSRGFSLSLRRYVEALTRRDILIEALERFSPIGTPGCARSQRLMLSLIENPPAADAASLLKLTASWFHIGPRMYPISLFST